MTDGSKLLTEYNQTGSESAFRELVACYVDLVYSAAVRLVDGEAHLADDVTQTVFVDLARLAGTFPRDVMLGGWLHRHTCFVAAKVLRGERRRRSRERQALEMNALQDHSEANLKWIAPILDEAINQLGADDRAAILLRFFEQRDFRSVGEALGSNEEAARKRVSRALDKLHVLLRRRGVAFSVAALATALAADAVHAAPAGMAAAVSGTALAAAAGTGATFTLFNLITMTNLKSVFIGAAAVAAAAAVPLATQHHAQVELRDENQSLRQQVSESTHLAAENQRLSNLLAPADPSPPADTSGELLRLRSEVTRLRGDSEELARIKAGSQGQPAKPAGSTDFMAKIKERLERMPNERIPEMQFLTDQNWQVAAQITRKLESDDDFRRASSFLRQAAKKAFAPKLGQALHRYADANDGRLPANLLEVKPFFAEPIADADALLQRYELKQTGKMDDVPQTSTFSAGLNNPNLDPTQVKRASVPLTEPIVAEKAPVDDRYDSLFNLTKYGYSFKSFGGGTGSGFGTWARVNDDGKVEVTFPPQGSAAPLSSASESRSSDGSGGSGGGSGGGGGGFSYMSQDSYQVRTTNAPAPTVP